MSSGLLRSRIDPGSTLPPVELHQLGSRDTVSSGLGWHAIEHSGAKVGELRIVRHGTERWINFILIKDSNLRGCGLGLAAHVTAIEAAHDEGDSFCNGQPLSEPSMRIWQRFIEAGVAEIITPFEKKGLVSVGGTTTRSYGGYAVIQPTQLANQLSY